MVSSTSREAYEGIKPKLGDKQRQVYSLLKTSSMPMNNEQIADRLGWPINCVTGRVSELRDFGMVVSESVGFSKSGRRTKMWTVCDLNDSRLRAISNDCEA